MLRIARDITPLRAALAGSVLLALMAPLFLHLCLIDGARLTALDCCQRATEQTHDRPCHASGALADSAGTLSCCSSSEVGAVDEAILTIRERSAQVAELVAAYVGTYLIEPAVDFVRDLATRLIPSASPRGSTLSLHLLNAVFLN